MASDGDPARPAGMYILKELPKVETIPPKGFKNGSRAEFEATLRKVKTTFTEGIVEQWEEFAKGVPGSDDVNEYLKDNPEAM